MGRINNTIIKWLTKGKILVFKAINNWCNNNNFFEFIGKQKLFKVRSVFLSYPASRIYSRGFSGEADLESNKWNPYITGFFIQKGKIGMMFSISAIERDFLKKDNLENLKMLESKMEYIRIKTRAKNKSFAGILQGKMYKEGFINDKGISITIYSIIDSIKQVQRKENLSSNIPIVIIGSNGFLGGGLKKSLEKKRTIYSIEIGDQIPAIASIVINVANRRSLGQHSEEITSEMIIINEVYPAPPLRVMEKIGVPVYQIQGAKNSRMYPRLPGGFFGTVAPLCASFLKGPAQIKQIY